MTLAKGSLEKLKYYTVSIDFIVQDVWKKSFNFTRVKTYNEKGTSYTHSLISYSFLDMSLISR